MTPRALVAAAIVMTLSVGCGSSPTTPSSPSPSSLPAAGGTWTTWLRWRSLAGQPPPLIPPSVESPIDNPVTLPCLHGGSMIMVFTPAIRPEPTATLTTSSRMEYHDCTWGTTVVNGDPHLEITGEHVPATFESGVSSGSSVKLRTTGGLRFSTNGVQGRSQYDCATVLSFTYPVEGAPHQTSIQSSGTITWEQPIGNTRVRPCP